jgi:predicted transcriptional regulator
VVRTQISLTEEQAEALRRLAALRRRSQAALIREALDDYLAADRRDDPFERSLSAIGACRSDIDDGRSVAVDHDAELDAAYLT